MNEAISALERYEKRSLMIGIAGAVLSAAVAFTNPVQFFRSYLFAYMFWLGLALGCLAITLLHHLSGGRWGAVVRKPLEAGTRMFPLLLLFTLPIILGMKSIYIWTDPHLQATDHDIKAKLFYLNTPFFLGRIVLYFAVWLTLSYFINQWSKQEEEASTPQLQSKFQFLGGIGLLLYGLTGTFAVIDWLMSLEPHWFSTIYGLLLITGQVLSAFAFVIALSSVLVKYEPLSSVMSPLQFHDLGKLMFAFLFIWAYLSFSQFLIIWSGNLPEEIPFYIARGHGFWEIISIILVLFHFAIPFLLLLSRDLKTNPRTLARVALLIMFMRYVDLYWLAGPELHARGSVIHLLDLLLPIAIGGLWLSYFFRQLKSQPLIPVNDPNLQEALEDART